MVYRAVRQLCRSDGGRPQQSPCQQPERGEKTAFARKLRAPQHDAPVDHVPAEDLRKGDVVLVEAGDIIPCDGEVIEGGASVDESAITGESAPVIRESGGDFAR